MPYDIDSSTSVNTVLQHHPSTLPVLNAFGVDTCCGGSLSLEEAAAADGIDLQQLLDAIADAIRAEHAAA